MDILLHNDAGRDGESLMNEVQNEQNIKFIVLHDGVRYECAVVFQHSIQHVEMARRISSGRSNVSLFGGKISVSSFTRRGQAKVMWGADSLAEQFGSDRPASEEEQQAVADILRQQIEESIRPMLQGMLS